MEAYRIQAKPGYRRQSMVMVPLGGVQSSCICW